MKKQKKLYFAAVLLILVLAILSQIYMPEESALVKNSRLNYICYFSMKKIGIALLQYSDKEGKGIFLPNDLSILVKNQYLPSDSCFCCGTQPETPYYYFPDLRRDMPHNIPILIERNAPHPTSEGKKGGFCLFLDFSVRYPLREGEDIFVIEDTKKALKIGQSDSKEFLLKTLAEPFQSDRVKSMCLWKLRQMEVFSTIIPEFLYAKSYAISQEAAYNVLAWDREKASYLLASFLYDSNYFIRKAIWKKLFPSSQEIDFISPVACEAIANKFLKRN